MLRDIINKFLLMKNWVGQKLIYKYHLFNLLTTTSFSSSMLSVCAAITLLYFFLSIKQTFTADLYNRLSSWLIPSKCRVCPRNVAQLYWVTTPNSPPKAPYCPGNHPQTPFFSTEGQVSHYFLFLDYHQRMQCRRLFTKCFFPNSLLSVCLPSPTFQVLLCSSK